MLLQDHEIDGSSAPVKSHGHHHCNVQGPREEVVLCTVYHFPEPKEAIQRLRNKFPHVRFIWHTIKDRTFIDHDGLVPDEDYRSATIYLTFNLSPRSRGLMPNLRFIQLLTSGHDHMRHTPLFSTLRPPHPQRPVPAATCAGVSARAIAQYVVLQVLSWAHQQPRALEVMARRRWVEPEATGEGYRRDGYPMASVLAGKRVGIWGYGNIGRQAARILHAMGMKIIACTSSEKTTPASRRLRNAASNPFNENEHANAGAMGDDEGILPTEWHWGATRASFHKFLAADLDILAIFTPLTPQTHHALGRDEFDVLSSRRCSPLSSSSSTTTPPSSSSSSSSSSHSSSHSSSISSTRGAPPPPLPPPFLVNVSRGPILRQDDLADALRDGRLAGAALDVTDPEPLPADHPLWALPNVRITPHVSWCFAEYVEDCLGAGGVFEQNLAGLLLQEQQSSSSSSSQPSLGKKEEEEQGCGGCGVGGFVNQIR